MSNNYDNWERLVVAVHRREKDRQLALAHSRESSISSASSSFNFRLDSPVHEQSLQLEASSIIVNEANWERFLPSTVNSSPGLSQFSTEAIDESGEILPTSNLKIYTFADLKRATKNFNSDMVLESVGSGPSGTVFMGLVDSKTLAPSSDGARITVAIMKLDPLSIQSFGEWEMTGVEWFEEWQTKVNFLGRLSHPNLVKLLGYCREDEELLLVYEFVQRGNLANHLYGRSFVIPLSWNIRLKIAIGAAQGLAFLHTSDKQVIYRDFKSSIILLDANYKAKITNFGLARLGPLEGNSHVETRVVGTYGYAAPEYVATGHLYVKSDVYGFGVVLLEMLTGLRVLDNNRPIRQKNLIDYAKPLLSKKRKLMTIMDARMKGQYSSKAALQAAQLILRCLEREPRKRPSMKEVVEVLEQIAGESKII